ncbi:hypothetical protein C8Q75DRAFT_774345 [Abortiporus biennis]|nr:hypothetical protein C8Q75DRAFT_774345 [Abortiporus biennis]
MGIFEPARESMKLSAVAVQCLTGEDFCLRVVEISPDGVFDGRNARISIWEDYEYRRRLYLARRHGHLKSLPYTLFYMVWQLTKWLFNLFVTTPCRIRCSVAKETYRGMEETIWRYAGPFITGYLRGRFYWRGIISVCSYVVYSLVTLACLVWCIVVVAPRPLWDALFLFQAGRYSWLGGSKALPIALEFFKSGTEEMTNMFLLLCFGIVLPIGFGLLRWGVAGMIMSIGVLVTAGMMSSVVVGEGVGRLPLQMMRMVI